MASETESNSTSTVEKSVAASPRIVRLQGGGLQFLDAHEISNSHFGRDAERLASFRSCSHPIQQLHFVLPIPTIRKLRAAIIMRIADQPHLRALRPSIFPAIAFSVRDQGNASSCTGHALAQVIDSLIHREVLAESPRRVSARMLYKMAKRNDEWTGTAYEGSSIRGAISGFYRNGVCSEEMA